MHICFVFAHPMVHACMNTHVCFRKHVCRCKHMSATAQTNTPMRKTSQAVKFRRHMGMLAQTDVCMQKRACCTHIRIYQGAQNKRAARIRTFQSASTHGEIDLPLRTRIDQPVNPYPAIESSTIIGLEPLQRLHGKMRRTCTAQHV